MLIGIVKRNAFMQFDFALDAQRSEGKRRSTMAVLPGVRPGAEARRRSSSRSSDGLLFSQLITLYLTRVYYSHLEAAVAAVGRVPGPSAGESRRAAAPRDRDRRQGGGCVRRMARR